MFHSKKRGKTMKPHEADFYCAVMFPYPSGAGLHIGHYFNYSIVDSYCRWLRRNGTTVFQPFGYDAFGLPAENYARSIGKDPKEVTASNIQKFRHQMKRMNTEYEERLVTSDPSYYKWTQWLFTQLYSKGLAYKKFGEVNYCNSCETVLANEQVKDGMCDRCGTPIQMKDMSQWYFRITNYKDRLIKNLDTLDYPEGTKKQQLNWLKNLKDWCVSRQRKWGCPIPVEYDEDTLDTFVDSSFYYLRYLTDSDEEFLPKECYKQVDLYIGGAEHACMHLIYARFIHMFLYDIGVVPVEEPFKKVIHQGMITAKGNKMGKSKGNAVEPDIYNADELRLYLMFLGPFTEGGDWDSRAIVGIKRFIAKIKLWLRYGINYVDTHELEKSIDRNVKSFKFNKVVSDFMKFYNKNKHIQPDTSSAERIEKLLKVFAPGFTSDRICVGDIVQWTCQGMSRYTHGREVKSISACGEYGFIGDNEEGIHMKELSQFVPDEDWY